MAGWLVRAIVMENVAARRRGAILELPAAPHFRLEKEIKNVITVIAKTCHYWLGHMPHDQQQAIADLFVDDGWESPFVEPDLSSPEARTGGRELAATIAALIQRDTGLRRSNHQYAGLARRRMPERPLRGVDDARARREQRPVAAGRHRALRAGQCRDRSAWNDRRERRRAHLSMRVCARVQRRPGLFCQDAGRRQDSTRVDPPDADPPTAIRARIPTCLHRSIVATSSSRFPHWPCRRGCWRRPRRARAVPRQRAQSDHADGLRRRAIARLLPGTVRHAGAGAAGLDRAAPDWQRTEIPRAPAGGGRRTSEHQRARIRRAGLLRRSRDADARRAWHYRRAVDRGQAGTEAGAGSHAPAERRRIAGRQHARSVRRRSERRGLPVARRQLLRRQRRARQRLPGRRSSRPSRDSSR